MTQPTSNTPPSPPLPLAHSHHVVDRLDAEWVTLRHDRRAIRTVHAWADSAPPHLREQFAAVTDLDDFFDLTHRRSGAIGDDLLVALVRLVGVDPSGSAGGQLAGRIVVQRLLPGMIDATRRYGGLCLHKDPLSEAVGALWLAIAQYDRSRRRGPIAPSLLSDTMFLAFRRRMRQASSTETPTEPATFDDQPDLTECSSFIELGAVIADARHAGVPTSDLDLLRHLIRAGKPGLVARQRKIAPRTVRNHRDRAIIRVQRSIGLPPRHEGVMTAA